jgi:Histidine kinase-, DNA gyrase B-, and HSP90-like ATPase
MSRKFRSAPPNASAMLESLRGLGYSPETALADTIDNSISAGASEVDLFFVWNGEKSSVTIVDNGRGMSGNELESAMHLGGTNPLAHRDSKDLGRFGLGMKTAAFSQCRRLTVLSRTASLTDACFCWDLDVLANSEAGEWQLLEGADESSLANLDWLPKGRSGTLVLWETLDRLVPPGSNKQDFLDAIDRIEQHLSMVFHRFLESSRSKLRIRINEKNVGPWNPFQAGSVSPSWSSPLERLSGGLCVCSVQGFVMPHKDRLTNTEYNAAAGINGWNAQQGFYVYRNDRLLVAGSWLGLGSPRLWTKDEIHRLARISLDFQNVADSEWKIDIRKSIAKPPLALRARLGSLGEDTRRRARSVFANKGNVQRRSSEEPVFEAWQSVVAGGMTKYRVNRDHPAVRAVLDSPLAIDSGVDTMLALLESTIPVQRIWLDTVEERTAPQQVSEAASQTIRPMLEALYRSLIKRDYSPEDARQRLSRTEPFQAYPQLVAELSALDIESETKHGKS